MSSIIYKGLALAASLALAAPVLAQDREISFYGGIQESPHTTVKLNGGGYNESFNAGWEGNSFDMPPYYGFRYTQWLDKSWGWSLNFTHAKAYSKDSSRTAAGYEILEFTDGANPITLNLMHRYAPMGKVQPYVGVGLGISVPHVEVKKVGETARTNEFQFGGPVIGFMGGAKYQLSPTWSVFAEYQFHYLMLDVKHNGGKLKTNLITNALNLGVNYAF